MKDDIPLQIAGSDIDPGALEVADAAVKKAGFAKEIKLTQCRYRGSSRTANTAAS